MADAAAPEAAEHGPASKEGIGFGLFEAPNADNSSGKAWYIETRDAFRSKLAGWAAEIEDELSSVILNISSDGGSAGTTADPSEALMTGVGDGGLGDFAQVCNKAWQI